MSEGRKSAEPIGHHTVPQVYLQRFRDPGLTGPKHPQLWVHPLDGGRARPESVAKAARVNRFYGPLERVLGEVIDVSRMKGIFDRLENMEAETPLAREDYDLLLSYVAFQYLRTPLARVSMDENRRGYFADHLRADPSADAKDLLAQLEAGERRASLSEREYLDTMVSLAPRIVVDLAQLSKAIVVAPSSSFFVTGDNPVAVGSVFTDEVLGIRNGDVLFPLSPRSCLWLSMGAPNGYIGGEDEAGEERVAGFVRQMNGLIARCSDRCVYSHREAGLADVGVAFPVATFRPVNIRLGDNVNQFTRALVPARSQSRKPR